MLAKDFYSVFLYEVSYSIEVTFLCCCMYIHQKLCRKYEGKKEVRGVREREKEKEKKRSEKAIAKKRKDGKEKKEKKEEKKKHRVPTSHLY